MKILAFKSLSFSYMRLFFDYLENFRAMIYYPWINIKMQNSKYV